MWESKNQKSPHPPGCLASLVGGSGGHQKKNTAAENADTEVPNHFALDPKKSDPYAAPGEIKPIWGVKAGELGENGENRRKSAKTGEELAKNGEERRKSA